MQNSWTIVATGLLTLALGCAGAAVQQPAVEKPVAARPAEAPSQKEHTLLLVTLAGLTWMAIMAAEEAAETETVHYRGFLPVRAETR